MVRIGLKGARRPGSSTWRFKGLTVDDRNPA